MPVRAMIPYGGFAIYVLYDDNQVWTIGWTTGCTFSGDLTRPDNPSIRPVSISTGAEFVATYEDGQVWAGPTNLHRVEMWERLNPVSSTDEPMPAPTSARPAPFSSSCTINLELPAAGPAAVRVFDVAGREIRALLEAELPAGACSIVWDGRDDAGQPAPAGVYFARVEAAGRAESVRLVLAH